MLALLPRWYLQNCFSTRSLSSSDITIFSFSKTNLTLTPGTIISHFTTFVVTTVSSVNRFLTATCMLNSTSGINNHATPRTTVWNLLLILTTLMRTSYVPLSTYLFRYLNFTLLSPDLRKAARRSHYKPFQGHCQGWTLVLCRLRLFRLFFRNSTVKSITDFISNSELKDESLLCPVRGIKHLYLHSV